MDVKKMEECKCGVASAVSGRCPLAGSFKKIIDVKVPLREGNFLNN
jgi:hypothetical protein